MLKLRRVLEESSKDDLEHRPLMESILGNDGEDAASGDGEGAEKASTATTQKAREAAGAKSTGEEGGTAVEDEETGKKEGEEAVLTTKSVEIEEAEEEVMEDPRFITPIRRKLEWEDEEEDSESQVLLEKKEQKPSLTERAIDDGYGEVDLTGEMGREGLGGGCRTVKETVRLQARGHVCSTSYLSQT